MTDIHPRPTKEQRARPHRLTASEVRTLVRHRDGYRCRLCGLTARQNWKLYKRKLDVHRLTPGSRYTVKGCITVCKKCHGPLPKSPRGSGGQKTGQTLIMAYVDPALAAFLREFARRTNRTLKAALEIAIRGLRDGSDNSPPG